MKAIICFKKDGEAKYFSHLDLQRTVDRALRRSGVDVMYSEGFNPHIKMSFAFALKVGYASEAEYLDVEMADDVDIIAAEKAIKASFPAGLDVNWVRKKKDDSRKLMACVAKAEYDMHLREDTDTNSLNAAIQDILASPTLLLTKRTKKGPREFDARPLIEHIQLDAEALTINMMLSAQEAGTLDPVLLMKKILLVANVDTEYTILRKDLYMTENEHAVSLAQLSVQ